MIHDIEEMDFFDNTFKVRVLYSSRLANDLIKGQKNGFEFVLGIGIIARFGTVRR